MTEPVPVVAAAITVEDADGAARLAERLLDGSRRLPLLGVAVPDSASAARVDTEALAEVVPGGVCLIVGPDATWALKRGLPPGLDVYGSAARLWWPAAAGLSRVAHPLALLDDRLEVDGVPLSTWAATELARGPASTGPAAHEVHETEQQAVVLRVDDQRAVVRLSDGSVAHLHASAFPGAGSEASRLVRVAQTLRVRVSPQAGQPPTVTPVWSPADARARLEAQCPVGSTVRGRVVSLRNHGALVSLLPGVVGLLHVSEVALMP